MSLVKELEDDNLVEEISESMVKEFEPAPRSKKLSIYIQILPASHESEETFSIRTECAIGQGT